MLPVRDVDIVSSFHEIGTDPELPGLGWGEMRRQDLQKWDMMLMDCVHRCCHTIWRQFLCESDCERYVLIPTELRGMDLEPASGWAWMRDRS